MSFYPENRTSSTTSASASSPGSKVVASKQSEQMQNYNAHNNNRIVRIDSELLAQQVSFYTYIFIIHDISLFKM